MVNDCLCMVILHCVEMQTLLSMAAFSERRLMYEVACLWSIQVLQDPALLTTCLINLQQPKVSAFGSGRHGGMSRREAVKCFCKQNKYIGCAVLLLPCCALLCIAMLRLPDVVVAITKTSCLSPSQGAYRVLLAQSQILACKHMAIGLLAMCDFARDGRASHSHGNGTSSTKTTTWKV